MSFATPVRWLYNIVRLLIMTGLILSVLIVVTIYVGSALPPVQRYIRNVAEEELGKALCSDVIIEDVILTPLNKVTLKRVAILPNPGDTAVKIQRIGAGINLVDLVLKSRIVINYTELIGLDARIWRDNASSPLNIQPIIDALSAKDKSKPPTKFDLQITTALIRKSALSYDVLDAPFRKNMFDPAHIHLYSLRADLMIPRISNDEFHIDLRRLAFRESSGFALDNLSSDMIISRQGSSARNLTISLPGTSVTFADINVNYDSWDSIKTQWHNIETNIYTNAGSYLTPADFSAFLPALRFFPTKASFDLDISGTPDSLNINRASIINAETGWWLNIEDAEIRHAASDIKRTAADIQSLKAGMKHDEIMALIKDNTDIPSLPALMLNNAGNVALVSTFSGDINHGEAGMRLMLSQGDIEIESKYYTTQKQRHIINSLTTQDFDFGSLFKGSSGALTDFGHITINAESDMVIAGNQIKGIDVSLIAPSVEYKEHLYTDLTAGMEKDGDKTDLRVALDNPAVSLMVAGSANTSRVNPALNFVMDIRNVNLATLNISDKYPHHTLSLTGNAGLSGHDINHLTGEINFSNISYTDDKNNGLILHNLSLKAEGDTVPSMITLNSDIADGYLSGQFHWQTLPVTIRNLTANIFPALICPAPVKDVVEDNNILFHLTVKNTQPISSFVKLPVDVIYDVDINGLIEERSGRIRLALDAPYLKQKDKLIENTVIDLSLDKRLAMTLSTMIPTKNGKMTLDVNTYGSKDKVLAGIEWNVDHDREFRGFMSVSTAFSRPLNDNGEIDYSQSVATDVNINPGELVFNDTVWNIAPSTISINPGRISVKGFNVGHDNQYVTISGTATADSSDSLVLRLSDVNLDYIFETLDISNVAFGGNATGTFFASSVLSKTPRMYTPRLHVDALTYNKSLMGDADIVSRWDTERKAVVIDADIFQSNGHHSYVNGRIMPMADSLDFHFKADRLPVGFLRPFMAAFAEDIDGHASGTARLWGSFKFIDMTGNIFAENVSLKLGFTGTTYWTTDSVTLTPGTINLRDITVRDRYGNTGTLNGFVTHKCFKEPRFEFDITDVRNMLVYDVKENIEHPWYGRVFANGRANIKGVPGLINIGINVSTASNSTFTLLLRDTQQANDYTFITFRDRDKAKKDSIRRADPTPEIVKRLRDRIANMSDDITSVYKMDFQVEVNPQAQVNIVMDPVGGDRIAARGSGNLRLTYDSANEDVRMFGTYTLTQGNYNFTLQDIIIKDFTIQDGSSISFQGNPYNALLDIRAYYALNANLSDLDESFLQDKDLNRTNVPVHAIMIVKGDMTQPDIDFDLEFPTLTQDTYRKVRSIVSTEDMMNRQIIYLLALNRFYTPDYMSATRGNELVSVASSTLSSQLGNILGQLSDKWSIAPNVRSDRGDFSDVEVDLALSSHLLNNRLLLNGNFGYRDKSLNTNTFVGDFDIEYLLNRAGTLRLKAYNRYNDQNYYLRSALTTQGVGFEIRRDFDSMTSFLRPLRKNRAPGNVNNDTVPAVLPHKEHPTTPSEFKTDLAPAGIVSEENNEKNSVNGEK